MDCRLSIGMAVALTLVGCIAPMRTYQPPQDPATLNETAFLHYLATVPTVTVAEGVRAMVILDKPPQNTPTFEDQWAHLVMLGAIKDAWDLRREHTLDKGTLAYMLTVVCKTPRSLSEAASGITGLGDRRYALKTCIDEGLLAYGLPHDAVTGGELLSALSKAEKSIPIAHVAP